MHPFTLQQAVLTLLLQMILEKGTLLRIRRRAVIVGSGLSALGGRFKSSRGRKERAEVDVGADKGT